MRSSWFSVNHMFAICFLDGKVAFKWQNVNPYEFISVESTTSINFICPKILLSRLYLARLWPDLGHETKCIFIPRLFTDFFFTRRNLLLPFRILHPPGNFENRIDHVKNCGLPF